MGNEDDGRCFTFVVRFLIDCTCGGTIRAIIVTIPMKKTRFSTVKYKQGKNCDEILQEKVVEIYERIPTETSDYPLYHKCRDGQRLCEYPSGGRCVTDDGTPSL